LTLTGDEGELQATLTWINENSFKMSVSGGEVYAYRKGFEPGGNILNHTATFLEEGWNDTIEELGFQESAIYKIHPSGGPYNFWWIELGDETSNTGDVNVTLYDAAGNILDPSFEEVDDSSYWIFLDEADYYLVVDCSPNGTPGTYSIYYENNS
jgi:hypothetical protein